MLPEELGNYTDESQLPLLRAEAVSLLNYDILVHLDRVEDYSPPSRSPSRGSFGSDTSGLPSDDPMIERPVRHRFVWQLGQPDALPDPPRASVHTRLGTQRDRSPPRGVGAGGSRQMQPPNQRDWSRSAFGGAGASMQWNKMGGGYQGQRRGHGSDSANGVDTEDNFFVASRVHDDQHKTDPMLEEAKFPASGRPQPIVSQRSVEPTVIERAQAIPDLLTGDDIAVPTVNETPEKAITETAAENGRESLVDEQPEGDAPLLASPEMKG